MLPDPLRAAPAGAAVAAVVAMRLWFRRRKAARNVFTAIWLGRNSGKLEVMSFLEGVEFYTCD